MFILSILCSSVLGFFSILNGNPTTTDPSIGVTAALSLGEEHSIMMKPDGSVWVSGDNAFGQLGNRGPTWERYSFVQVVDSGAVSVATLGVHSMMVKQDGSVWATGSNADGQLGDGTTLDKNSYVKVVPSGGKTVATGYYHSALLKQDGSVWTTGYNEFGGLGDGTVKGKTRFVKVVFRGATAVAASVYNTMVLKRGGSLLATGDNKYGQVGDGTKTDRRRFEQVIKGGVEAVAAGDFHTMVLKEDGSVWGTGYNGHGQLGDGSTDDKLTFVQVVSSDVKAVVAGEFHSMVLKQDGSVWATGDNIYGQLGDATRSPRTNFVQVISSGVETVAVGCFHSMVMKQDGSVWGTGDNEFGQLGEMEPRNRSTFVKVTTTKVCPMCSIIKSSGRPSCCARGGGAWFDQCGEAGDSEFNHTWADGIQACRGNKFRATTVSTTCPTCGIVMSTGKTSCCGRGGSWYQDCGAPGDSNFGHNWYDGIQACKDVKPLTTLGSICPTCGIVAKTSKTSCCGHGGAWFEKCGNPGDTNFEYTWFDGIVACKGLKPVTTTPKPTCPKCGIIGRSGKTSCCGQGGAWFKKCGHPGDSNFEYAWSDGIASCRGVTPPITTPKPTCPKCGIIAKTGKTSCCGHGGAWFEKCGNPGDTNFEYTWLHGIAACKGVTPPTTLATQPLAVCPVCGILNSGKLSCCTKGGSWFGKCGGPEEQYAYAYTWLEGIITCKGAKPPTTVATPAPPKCPKCGMPTSGAGKPSCCTRGGTWFGYCGGSDAAELGFIYTWADGIQACKGVTVPPTIATTRPPTPSCPKCGTTTSSNEPSCCGRGGAWFGQCGGPGDSKFGYTWLDGIKACDGFTNSLSDNAQAQAMRLITTTRAQDGSQPNVIDSATGDVSHAVTTDDEVCAVLSKIFTSISVLITVMSM